MSEELCEEQEMEAEALAAIFDDCLEIISSTQPFEWAVDLYPEQLAADEEDEDAPQNHVGVKVIAKIPLTYPEESLPEFNIKVLKGLTEEHEQELVELANEEAENNRGMPVMYAVCERLREWLLENNEKGMDDRSMYTQMLKREKEKEREKVRIGWGCSKGHQQPGYQSIPTRAEVRLWECLGVLSVPGYPLYFRCLRYRNTLNMVKADKIPLSVRCDCCLVAVKAMKSDTTIQWDNICLTYAIKNLWIEQSLTYIYCLVHWISERCSHHMFIAKSQTNI